VIAGVLGIAVLVGYKKLINPELSPYERKRQLVKEKKRDKSK